MKLSRREQDSAPELFLNPGHLGWSAALMPALVLLAGLCLSLLVWSQAAERARVAVEEDVEHRADLLTSQLRGRLRSYEQLLRGVAGLFAASDSVSIDEFRRYVLALEMPSAYPGLQGVGFAERLGSLSSDRTGSTADRSVETALGSVKIWPGQGGEEASAIRLLEPLDWRNQRALGFDMFSDPARRAAMARAVDQGTLGMTGRVTLVQEADEDVQNGFLMYVPVYRDGESIRTAEQRREALLGWAFAPFRAEDFMQAVVGAVNRNTQTPLELAVYAGVEARADNLLYASSGALGGRDREPLFRASSSFTLGGAHWTLQFSSTPELEARLHQQPSLWILLTGAGLSLLLAVVLWLLGHGRSRAWRYAARMNRHLRESEQRFRRLADAAPVLIALGDPELRLQWANRGWLEFRGRPLEAEAGEGWLEGVHPEDVVLCKSLIERPANPGQALGLEFRLLHADGSYRWVLNQSVPQYGPDGAVVGFIGTFVDITDRKRAEEALRRANHLVNSVLTAAVDTAITVTDRDGTVQLFNPGAERLLGLRADEVIGSRRPNLWDADGISKFEWYDDIAEEHSVGPAALRHEALAAGQAQREWTYQRPDGEQLRISLVLTPLREPDGSVSGWLGMARDITAQYAAEQRLLESERRLRAVFDASFSIIGLLSPAGTLLDVNRTALRAGKVGLEQVLGIPFWQGPWWQTPTARDTIHTAVRTAAAGQEMHGEVATGYGAHPTTIAFSIRPVFDEQQRVVLLVLEGQDITERKRAESKLSEQRLFLDKLMSEIPDMVSYWNADQRCRFANPAWKNTFSRVAGMAADELVGSDMARMLGGFYGSVRADVAAVLRGAVQRRERTLAVDDDTRHLLMHFRPDIVDREVVGFVVVATDITELKRIERSLQEQVQRAESATRAKSDFVANMSHEIRTPMNAVLGLTRLLVDTELDSQQRDYVEMIHSSSRALLQILNDILDYSKVEAGRLDLERDEFGLDEVLENCADLFAVMVESRQLELL
ncbi:MAG: PAS domain-containing protein, partial [Spongiibacteraceae bacterium]|nr:PAS domain-containing protein [Spongiibacteraceae bacterium]